MFKQIFDDCTLRAQHPYECFYYPSFHKIIPKLVHFTIHPYPCFSIMWQMPLYSCFDWIKRNSRFFLLRIRTIFLSSCNSLFLLLEELSSFTTESEMNTAEYNNSVKNICKIFKRKQVFGEWKQSLLKM